MNHKTAVTVLFDTETEYKLLNKLSQDTKFSHGVIVKGFYDIGLRTEAEKVNSEESTTND